MEELEKEKELASPCTESLSLRDFWHFACGADSDARSKQGCGDGGRWRLDGAAMNEGNQEP